MQGLKYLEFHHLAEASLAEPLLGQDAKDGLIEVEDVKELLDVAERVGKREWFREAIGMSGGGGGGR